MKRQHPFSSWCDSCRMSAHLGVERLEAIGLAGTTTSSLALRATAKGGCGLDLALPARQHWTKYLRSSVCVLTGCARLYHCRIHRSLPSPINRFGRNIALRVRHVPNAIRKCSSRGKDGTTRSPELVPAGTALRRRQRRIWFSRADDHAAACSKASGTPSMKGGPASCASCASCAWSSDG